MAAKSGVPYQKLLNQILKDGLVKNQDLVSRLDRMEKELKKLKKLISA
jgi:hypothetical protein